MTGFAESGMVKGMNIDVDVKLWDGRRVMLSRDFIDEDRDKLLQVFERVAQGEYWRVALKDAGVDYAWVSAQARLRPRTAGFLLQIANVLCQGVRQKKREEEADRRAVDGYEEEVYTASGKFAGMRKRYSDSLLALQLRAGDPQKYRETVALQQTGVVLQVNLGIVRNPASVEEIETESEAVDRVASPKDG